ncbi:hypothetical protein KKD52_06450 [Myxococcota bacterium]|nr:hypothetical protein [Myxococcota bacterium]MBU1413289.1 hypothetical protein [Myxococcota bacterium]MBU1509984.1 hypothetical protein [Myxococcota bacterium]
MYKILSFLSVLFFFTACTVPDADLAEKSAVADARFSASTDQLAQLKTRISGSITLGYTSPQRVTLSIYDGEVPVLQKTYDATALEIPVDEMITLAGDGERQINFVVDYNARQVKQTLILNVALTAPLAVFDAWTTDFDPDTGVLATGGLTVTVDAAYTIESVRYAVDKGAWFDASSVDGVHFPIAITNPDIGEVLVDTEVVARLNGELITARFSDSFAVAPEFDCNNPAQAMIPENDLVSNMTEEHRVMKGYFGDPQGGHVLSFVVTANVQGDGIYQSVGEVQSYGPTAVGVKYYVSPLRCENNPCNTAYRLDFFLDGILQCSRDNFGVIYRY